MSRSMTKSVAIIVLGLSLLFNPIIRAQAQNEVNQPPLDEIWSSMIEFSGMSEVEIKKECPNFPINEAKIKDVDSWINSNQSETEKMMALFANHDVHPSRIQLGLNDLAPTLGQLVPHWQNALNSYGDVSKVIVALPHLPNPHDFCEVVGYLKDVEKRESWRGEYGYGSDANELLDESEAPDANLLFDVNEYPCLAQYYLAIDKWVYDYPKEYEKLMNACDCGGNEPIVMHVMPDSLKQPWESPLERIRKAKEQEAEIQLQSDKNELVFVPKSNPFKLLEAIDSDLNQLKIEEIIATEGGQAFRDYLFDHLTQVNFEFVIQSSTVWYMQNDQQAFDIIRQSAATNEDFFVGLSEGSTSIESVDDEKFVSIFNSQVK